MPAARERRAVSGGERIAGSGVERIATAFAAHGRRAALMPYLMGGHPTLADSVRVGEACADAGADLLELGVPFSDPLADGPVIQAAGTEALARGATVGGVMEVCAALSGRLPVVLMVYANLVLAPGARSFVARSAEAGAAGLIVPDLPHDEAGELRAVCDERGLALVPLVAPGTPAERLDAIARDARGFVYTVSLAGTTGERVELPPALEATVARVRAASSVPVAVGFGIASPEHARRVAEVADGVIVGSRVVRAAGEGGPDAVRELVASLAAALA
jgi:tryptophan synthase alpha chain